MPTVTAEQLGALLATILEQLDAPACDARLVADMLVEADLMGMSSHGARRLAQYIQDIERGHIVPGAKVRVTRQTATTAIVDGGWNFGQVAASYGVALAIDKARQSGMGCFALRRCRHIGRLGAYTECAAQQGYIAMGACGAGSEGFWVAPFGGREGRLSTCPLSFAAPTDADPIVMDFSTCSAPEGKVNLLRELGKSLPESWLLDAAGKPTIDPNDLYNDRGGRAGAITPFGGEQGYKGYSLALMVQILTTLLGDPFWQKSLDEPESHANGMWLMVIDPGAFMPASQCRAQISALINHVRSSAPAEGFDAVLIPGQREHELRAQFQRDGIPIADETWHQIERIAVERGVST